MQGKYPAFSFPSAEVHQYEKNKGNPVFMPLFSACRQSAGPAGSTGKNNIKKESHRVL